MLAAAEEVMLYLYSSQHLVAPGSSSWARGDILQDQICCAASSSSTEWWSNPLALAIPHGPLGHGSREPRAPGGGDKA